MAIWIYSIFMLYFLNICLGATKDTELKVFRGKFKGDCNGDGLYYMDEHSFIMCNSKNFYIQPCPPGTMNQPYDGYASGSKYAFENFCDINLVNYGYTEHQQKNTKKDKDNNKKVDSEDKYQESDYQRENGNDLKRVDGYEEYDREEDGYDSNEEVEKDQYSANKYDHGGRRYRDESYESVYRPRDADSDKHERYYSVEDRRGNEIDDFEYHKRLEVPKSKDELVKERIMHKNEVSRERRPYSLERRSEPSSIYPRRTYDSQEPTIYNKREEYRPYKEEGVDDTYEEMNTDRAAIPTLYADKEQEANRRHRIQQRYEEPDFKIHGRVHYEGMRYEMRDRPRRVIADDYDNDDIPYDEIHRNRYHDIDLRRANLPVKPFRYPSVHKTPIQAFHDESHHRRVRADRYASAAKELAYNDAPNYGIDTQDIHPKQFEPLPQSTRKNDDYIYMVISMPKKMVTDQEEYSDPEALEAGVKIIGYHNKDGRYTPLEKPM